MKNVTRLRERKGAARRGAPIWLAAALLLLGFNGCEWNERLPFKGNELDPALLGFWLEVPSNPKACRIADSVGVYKLSQFERDGDDYHRVLLECPFEAFGRVVRVAEEPVFTKKVFFYRIENNDLFTYYLDARPYSVHGNTLTIRSREYGWVRYVRVSDTSTVDWATRRAMRKRKG